MLNLPQVKFLYRNCSFVAQMGSKMIKAKLLVLNKAHRGSSLSKDSSRADREFNDFQWKFFLAEKALEGNLGQTDKSKIFV